MSDPKPSRRATERHRDNAVLNALLKPDIDLLAIATANFKSRDPFSALIRWFTPERRRKLHALVAINDLRTELTLSQSRQPAAAALLRLTSNENPETARKASADLLKSAPKRAQARKTIQSRSKKPPRSDRDQQDMDAILDRMKPIKPSVPVLLAPASSPGPGPGGGGGVTSLRVTEGAQTSKVVTHPSHLAHDRKRGPQ